MPERGIPGQELIDQNSQRPPVHRGGVTLVMDDLRREILGRAAQSVRLFRVARLVVPQTLGETKVNQLDVPVGIQQQVFRFHVPVSYPSLLFVKVLKDQHDFGGVKPGHVFVEPAILAQVSEKLAPGHVVEEDVEEVAVRKRRHEVGNERMPSHIGQNLSLVADMVDLLQFDHCDTTGQSVSQLW